MAQTYYTNEKIFDRQVRVIDEQGNQKGVMFTREALAYAYSVGLDLVKINDAKPYAVCKVVDANKFIYNEKKAKDEADKRQRAANVTIKEVQLRPSIDTNDLMVKARKANEFIAAKDKVKVVMRFRGREMMHKNIGREKFAKFIEQIADYKFDRQQTETHNEIMVILAPAVPKSK